MKEVTCMCGWRTRGSEDEIIDQVVAHGRDAHGVETTREEVLAIAVDVPAPTDVHAGPS
jgi:predicted small metal-binding protein